MPGVPRAGFRWTTMLRRAPLMCYSLFDVAILYRTHRDKGQHATSEVCSMSQTQSIDACCLSRRVIDVSCLDRRVLVRYVCVQAEEFLNLRTILGLPLTSGQPR